jgi:hypothetical protein
VCNICHKAFPQVNEITISTRVIHTKFLPKKTHLEIHLNAQ